MTVARMQISEEQLSAFIIYLALGVLQTILERAVPSEVGIWTLGAPQMWSEFEGNSHISQEVIDTLQACDELSALQELAPEKFEDEVKKLIKRLHNELSKIPDPIWSIKWTIPA